MSRSEVRDAVRSVLEHQMTLPWDTGPTLGYIYSEPLDADGFIVVARQIPLDPRIWELGHPVDVLRVLAEDWPPARIAFDLRALVLTCESWVLADATTKERDWVGHNSIADHPRGREAKTVYAVDVDGHRYMGAYRRGDAKAEYMDAGRDGIVTRLGGRVVDELDAVLARMTRAPA